MKQAITTRPSTSDVQSAMARASCGAMPDRSRTVGGRPSSRGSCASSTSRPTAARKPPMTGRGMACTKRPRRAAPKAICITPARKVATMRPLMPCRLTISKVSGASATSGPLICSFEPPNSPASTPASTPVMMPAAGGRPHAMARARFSGSATKATVMPASTLSTTRPRNMSAHDETVSPAASRSPPSTLVFSGDTIAAAATSRAGPSPAPWEGQQFGGRPVGRSLQARVGRSRHLSASPDAP